MVLRNCVRTIGPASFESDDRLIFRLNLRDLVLEDKAASPAQNT